MANKISFIIQLKDQFKRNARAIKRQFRDIREGADKASAKVSEFGKKTKAALIGIKKNAAIAGAAMTAGLTVPLTRTAQGFIAAASAAQETSDKFRDVFVGVNGAADAVKQLSSEYKLATTSSKNLLAQTGAILSASGLQKDRILEISSALNKASVDLTSFHDFQGDAAEASMILTKALLGEAESLKTNFGITIRQGTKAFNLQVRQKMRAMRISEQAARAEVIFAEVLKQAGKDGQNALGNFNKTIGSYANQLRIVREQQLEFSVAMGTIILPVATKMIQAFGKILEKLNSLSPAMKTFMLVVGGLVAIGGPLLLVVAGIAAAFAFITAPIALVTTGILAAVAAIGLLVAKWDKVKGTFGKVKSFFGFAGGAPSAPIASGGSLDGNITVSAAPGATVESTSLATKGAGLNIGMNMAAAQ